MAENSSLAVVVGLDGGGSHTRALVADLSGRPLGFAETGGSSPSHNPEEVAEANVRQAITEAIVVAGRELSDVVCLVAGMAGVDEEADQVWAEQYTAVPGLNCPRIQVNDAVVAHRGALCFRPGIIIIAGTGAITFGVTESGLMRGNYAFNHYADAAGRTLAYNAVYLMLVGDDTPADASLVQKTLDYWKVQDREELRSLVLEIGHLKWKARVHRYGGMAPLVTEAAALGSPLARKVCDRAIEEMAMSIRLLGADFASKTVEIAPIGSVAQCPYMTQALTDALATKRERQYRVVAPSLPPDAGAVLMALQYIGFPPDAAMIDALRRR